jgi:geranylgeranyl diphosphate synthase type I
MFALAHLTLLQIKEVKPATITLEAAWLLQQTCLQLTQGQFLDISYEDKAELLVEDYWPMVSGKTAALLSACTELGALIAGADETTRAHYRDFGRDLGLAFQAQDDYLGIWGDAALTGKSNASDLITRKKSLPVLYALGKNKDFAKRWNEGPISPQEVPALASQLKNEGAYAFTQEQSKRLTQRALAELESAQPQSQAGEALLALANLLLKREA